MDLEARSGYGERQAALKLYGKRAYLALFDVAKFRKKITTEASRRWIEPIDHGIAATGVLYSDVGWPSDAHHHYTWPARRSMCRTSMQRVWRISTGTAQWQQRQRLYARSPLPPAVG